MKNNNCDFWRIYNLVRRGKTPRGVNCQQWLTFLPRIVVELSLTPHIEIFLLQLASKLYKCQINIPWWVYKLTNRQFSNQSKPIPTACYAFSAYNQEIVFSKSYSWMIISWASVFSLKSYLTSRFFYLLYVWNCCLCLVTLNWSRTLSMFQEKKEEMTIFPKSYQKGSSLAKNWLLTLKLWNILRL